MTYALVVDSGAGSVVMPNGLRYAAAADLTLSDRQFGLLTAGAKAVLAAGAGGTSTGSLGGTVSHQVTITSALRNVVLPNGGDGLLIQGTAHGNVWAQGFMRGVSFHHEKN